jgi:hypothetical protein
MATLDQLSDLAADAGERPVPKDEELSDLRSLVARLGDQQREVERLGRLHSEAVSAERRLAFIEIPALLMRLGVTSFGLDDGRLLALTKHYRCTIDDPAAFDWLDRVGASGIIKADVTAVFGKEEIETARALADEIEGRGIPVKHEQSVHPQTLKAFCRERMESDPPLPIDESIKVTVELEARVLDATKTKRRGK